MAMVRSLAFAIAGGLALSLIAAEPAAAHSVGGVEPTNYRSEIVSISPPVAGIELRLRELGRKVQLTNFTETDAIVLGYDGEPYLRVGPQGTFENTRSPTLYKNRPHGPSGEKELPPQADATAPPEWKQTGSDSDVRWSDQRTRWEGPEPAHVRAAPDKEHLLSQWSITMQHGDQAVVATGTITWIPGPSALPWLVLALSVFVVTVALAWGRRWGPSLAGAVAVLVAVDMVQSFASAASSGDAVVVTILKVVALGFVSTLAWIAGGWSVIQLRRNNEMGLVVAAIAAFIIALYALGDGAALGRSQVPYVLPAATARAAIALTLGTGFGVVIAAVVVFRRNPGLVTRAADSEVP